MRNLLTVVLATAWVLGVIRYMGTRRHPRETPDHIDRDFREMVARYMPGHQHLCWYCWQVKQCGPTGCKDAPDDYMCEECKEPPSRLLADECPKHGPNCTRHVDRAGARVHTGPPTQGAGRGMCPVHGWRCWGGHNGESTN